MQRVFKLWRNIAITILIVIVNLFFVAQFGLAYAHFDWMQYAAAYLPFQIFLPFVSK